MNDLYLQYAKTWKGEKIGRTSMYFGSLTKIIWELWLESIILGSVKTFSWLQTDNCVKSVQIRSFSGPCFPVLLLYTEKYGPEKTPYLETFHTMTTYGLQHWKWRNTYLLHTIFPCAKNFSFFIKDFFSEFDQSRRDCGIGHIYWTNL